VGVVGLVLAGCGAVASKPRPTVAASAHDLTEPPGKPVAEIDDLAFRDGDDGLLGASQPRGSADIGAAVLERTTDAGTAWTPVWHQNETSLTWVGFAGPRVPVAAGVAYPYGTGGQQSPLLVVGDAGDGGWRAIAPELPDGALAAWPALRFQFVSTEVGFATVDPNQSRSLPGSWLLRSTDGGRRWTRLSVAGRAVAAVDFRDSRVGYAAVSDPRRTRCTGELFHTTDGGTTWRGLPASCRGGGAAYLSVDFLDGRTGFAGGGATGRDYDSSDPSQVTLATVDAGRSWREQVSAYNGLRIVGLAFADPTHGWAATQDACKLGSTKPCGRDVLTTRDGGRSWIDAGVAAEQLATVGAQDAWAVPDCLAIGPATCHLIRRSTDAGQTWQTLSVDD
jgi:photosystem II stability/assembly factor-like uncharacterized protein